MTRTAPYKFSGALLAAACLTLIAAEVAASGLYLPGRGVRPMGRAGAYVASGEGDLNSLWYNPANLNFEDDIQLHVDFGGIDLDYDFHRATRTRDGDEIGYDPVSNQGPIHVSPQLLIGGPVNDDSSWAFGLYAPYLSPMTFPEDGPQRNALVDSGGSALVFLNAAYNHELSDRVRIGVGVQNAMASYRLVTVTSGYTGMYGRPEDRDLDILTEITLEDYFAPAANAGVWARFGPKIHGAISAQSPVFIRDNNAELRARMPSHPSFDGARLSDDPTIGGAMKLAPIVRAGLGFDLDPVELELAGVWEGWSIFDEIEASPNDVEVENVDGLESIPIGPLTIPKNFNDAFSVRLGGDVDLTDDLVGRAGYAFETAAVPDTHHSVFLADGDKHVASLGASFTVDRLRFDAGAAYYHLLRRDIDDSEERQVNPTDADDELTTVIGNGEYSGRYLIIGLGARYRFE
ncbi:MAG: OmpP1/FadL family transporter [Persicimonas sp.]